MTPNNDNWHALGLGGSLKKFFEGLYPLFWIEVLSIMGMVPIGAPSLRRIISWVKVSTAPPCHSFAFEDGSDSVCRMPIQRFLREFRTFVISSSCSIPPSRSALHTPIFPRYPSYPHDRHCQPPSAQYFTKAIKVKRGKLLSWPTPPLEWIGHTGGVSCMSYSPNGCHIVTGSYDETIRIWDAETGSTIGEPLKGHTAMCSPLLTLPMGGTSSLDLMTRPFESGMLRLVL
jgi:WD40 repeat protein